MREFAEIGKRQSIIVSYVCPTDFWTPSSLILNFSSYPLPTNQYVAQKTFFGSRIFLSGSSETTKEETVQCDENISEVKRLRPKPSHCKGQLIAE